MPTDRDSTAAPGRERDDASGLAMLAADHERVRQLAEEYQTLLESSEEKAAGLVEEICSGLELHSALEEEVLYPAVARVSELALLIDQAREDHDRVKEIIEEIRMLEPADPQVAGLIVQLAEDVEAHASEEEAVLFPEIEQRMADQLAQVGRQMALLRQRLQQR